MKENIKFFDVYFSMKKLYKEKEAAQEKAYIL